MSLQKESMKGLGLLVAGMFLAVPMIAQQEIAPDHFDSTPNAPVKKSAVQHSKSASAQSKNSAVSHVSRGTKSNPASHASAAVKSEPTTVADSRSR